MEGERGPPRASHNLIYHMSQMFHAQDKNIEGEGVSLPNIYRELEEISWMTINNDKRGHRGDAAPD